MHNNFSVKVLFITSLPVVSAFLFGVFFKNFISSAHLGIFVVAIVMGLVFLAAVIVFNILEGDWVISSVSSGLSAAAMTVSFLGSASMILFSGTLIAFCLIFFSNRRTQFSVQNNLKVKFWGMASTSASFASSGISIFAILAYLSLFNFSDPASLKKTLEVAIKPMEPIFSSYIPGFTIRHTITQIAASLLPDDLKLAPAEIKSQVIQQASDRLMVILGNYIKIPVSGGDKVIDIVYKATLGKILNYSPLVRNLILVAAGFIIFLLLKFILIFVNWLAIALAYGIYSLLLSLKFFEIQLQSIDKEVIVIK
ncbi:MAG: hypothetical protein Q7S83_00670 [bacterium]|nr:hypothetical protein [bacterium]